MKPEGLVFLRPYLWRALGRGFSAAKPCAETYARFYATGTSTHHRGQRLDYAPKSAEARTRMEELKRAGMLEWPRLEHDPKAMRLKTFISRYKSLEKGQVVHDETVTLRGTSGRERERGAFVDQVDVRWSGSIVQTREAGQKLVFLDVSADKEVVQAVGSLGAMAAAHVDQSAFRRVFRQHRRGDSVGMDVPLPLCTSTTVTWARSSHRQPVPNRRGGAVRQTDAAAKDAEPLLASDTDGATRRADAHAPQTRRPSGEPERHPDVGAARRDSYDAAVDAQGRGLHGGADSHHGYEVRRRRREAVRDDGRRVWRSETRAQDRAGAMAQAARRKRHGTHLRDWPLLSKRRSVLSSACISPAGLIEGEGSAIADVSSVLCLRGHQESTRPTIRNSTSASSTRGTRISSG